mgnify:CR=1 FL=1
MMPKQNIKDIKNEINKNNRRKRFRKISLPKMDVDRHLHRPFSGEFANGNFRNDIYFSMKPAFITWVYMKNILLYCIPAFLLHGVMFLIHRISIAAVGDEYTAPVAAFQLLFFTYAICLFFALRKVSDHMTYYNITMLISKYKINQSFLTLMYRGEDVETNKEMVVMDHYRQRFNKYSLFPSMKELALEEQLYQIQNESSKDSVRQFAQMRRHRLSISSKRDEHIAAKDIADQKQRLFGGANEYDEMVAKYKNRTVPAIRDIIADVQNEPEYNV